MTLGGALQGIMVLTPIRKGMNFGMSLQQSWVYGMIIESLEEILICAGSKVKVFLNLFRILATIGSILHLVWRAGAGAGVPFKFQELIDV